MCAFCTLEAGVFTMLNAGRQLHHALMRGVISVALVRTHLERVRIDRIHPQEKSVTVGKTGKSAHGEKPKGGHQNAHKNGQVCG